MRARRPEGEKLTVRKVSAGGRGHYPGRPGPVVWLRGPRRHNDPRKPRVEWATYATAPGFTLSSGSGTKTVYFKVKNEAGESSAVSDSIEYNPAVVTVSPAVPTQCPKVATQCPALATSCPATTTKCPAVTTKCPAVSTQCPAAATFCPACP